jgi:hypothetical protein
MQAFGKKVARRLKWRGKVERWRDCQVECLRQVCCQTGGTVPSKLVRCTLDASPEVVWTRRAEFRVWCLD